MDIIQSRNTEEQRREMNGITYFDRGPIEDKDGRRYDRFAIQTHFVQIGEDQTELVKKYVCPIWQEGDILSFGAKVMCMCVKSVRTREEVKPGFWAKLLWRFAGENGTGIGAHEPYKMQLIIDICGLPRVLLAATLSAVTKIFRMRGVFWKVCGHGVGGIDGFYNRSSFDIYHHIALINPDNPDELCEKIRNETGIPVMLIDANDIQQDILGKSSDFPLTNLQIQAVMADNPSGQDDELTPLILIRPL